MTGWALLLLGISAFAQNTLQEKVEAALAREPLASAAVGVSVIAPDGTTLVDVNAGRRLVPASNMKLVTTGAALHSLGPNYRYQTCLGYSGTIVDGTLEGDLFIIGGGDPTLGTRDSIAVKTDALFREWRSMLTDAGIRRIHGNVVGDGRSFEGMLENGTWSYEDVGTYYGPGGSALSFYANAIDFAVEAGEEGESVSVTQKYPDTPWIHFENHSFTGPAGTGNSLYLYTTDLAPYAELRGTFAVDRKPKTEHFANKYGALTCAFYFWKNLKASGIEVTGGYADIDRGGYIRESGGVASDRAPENLTVLGSSLSPSLREIARETNFRSDNFYAETLLRTLGECASGISVYDSCRVALNEVLEALFADAGIPAGALSGLKPADGSGLSRQDFVSPAFFTAFLRAMIRSHAFDAYVESLPYPDAKGATVYGMLRLTPPEDRSRLRFKSGSMDGVLCYSGYIFPLGGGKPLVFSLMVNNASAPTSEIRSALERILKLLL